MKDVTAPPDGAERTTLRELALLFLRLGATAFGGPAAHIAMMRDEVVRRRGWLTEARFLDLLSAANLIPGPNSTELAIHIGFERRRWAGLLVAGLSFIVPAMLITGAFAWAYVRFGALPQVSWLLWGVKPVILAVVFQALRNLAAPAAVAVGQVTPGPVFSTATFIGYVLAGVPGASVATAGIFLPAFVFVAVSGPLVPRLRASPAAGAFLDGVNVASLALMVVVTAQLARTAIVDVWTGAAALVAAGLLLRFRTNSTWLVLGGAVWGFAVHAAGLARQLPVP